MSDDNAHRDTSWSRSETTHVEYHSWSQDAPMHNPAAPHVLWEDADSGNTVLLLDASRADDRRLLWRSSTGAVRDMSTFAWDLTDRAAVIAAVDQALMTAHPTESRPT